MEELDLNGQFWVANEPEDKVQGSVRFDPSSGAKLHLHRGFVNRSPSDQTSHIFGLSGNRHLTLNSCRLIDEEVAFPLGEDPYAHSSEYSVTAILVGQHIPEHAMEQFNGAILELASLETWTDLKTFIPSDSSRDSGTGVPYNSLHSVTHDRVDADFGEILLRSRLETSRLSDVEICYKRRGFFEFKFPSGIGYNKVKRYCDAIQDLVTLGTNSTSYATRIALLRANYDEVSELTLVHDYDLYIPYRGAHAAAQTTGTSRSSYFSFVDIGGLSGLLKWMHQSEDYSTSISALLSHRYLPSIYAHNYLLNLVTSAEQFHRKCFSNKVLPKSEHQTRVREIIDSAPVCYREWLKSQLLYSNEPRLRERLHELAEYAGSPYSTLVNNLADWAKRVASARNDLVHRPDDARFEYEDLRDICASLQFLMIFCLFKKCGMPDGAFAKIQEDWRFTDLAKRMNR